MRKYTVILLCMLLQACASSGEQSYNSLDRDITTVEEFLRAAVHCRETGGRVVVPHKVGTRIRKPITWEELQGAHCAH